MKKGTLIGRLFAMLLCCAMMLSSVAGAEVTAGTHTRQATMALLDAARAQHEQNPDDVEAAIAYGHLLYELTDFDGVKSVLEPLLLREEIPSQALYLMAEIAYLHGDYDQAEAYYSSLMNDPAYQMQAQAGLLLVYYQRNEYAKAVDIPPEADALGLRDMMMAFGDTAPYQIEWEGTQESITPFATLDPLPTVSTEINGRQIDTLIDTGASEFFVDETLAQELGITPISQVEGIGGGGTQAVSFGIAESISLNGVTIKNVPVIIMPIKQFSEDFDDSVEINGILGVKLMQQFLTVMDYQQQQIELRPRTEENVSNLKAEIAAAGHAERIPMQFASDHYLLGKLTVNDTHSLNFFFDSGLSNNTDDAEQILLPVGTLEYLGMPLPETDLTDEVGGLGGAFTYGIFTVDSVAAGAFRHENVNGAYGIFPEPLYYDMTNFYVDGLVSHNFFREYRWSIDFDSMEMAFTR